MCRFEFDWPYRIKRISSLIGQVFPCRGRVYRFEAGLVREYIEGKVSIGRVRYLLNIVLFHVGVRITSFPLQFRPIYFLLIPIPYPYWGGSGGRLGNVRAAPLSYPLMHYGYNALGGSGSEVDP